MLHNMSIFETPVLTSLILWRHFCAEQSQVRALDFIRLVYGSDKNKMIIHVSNLKAALSIQLKYCRFQFNFTYIPLGIYPSYAKVALCQNPNLKSHQYEKLDCFCRM